MTHLTYAEAMVVGLIQGVTELFPISSLGHNVLIPALIGGSWAKDLNVSAPESPYLAFIVGLHVATALAMIIYFWRDWLRIIRGLVSSLASCRIVTADQRLAWMIILATIPVGIAGLALEHLFRVVFSRPIPTALFLAVNGVILLGGERVRKRRDGTRPAAGQIAAAWPGEPALATAGAAIGPEAPDGWAGYDADAGRTAAPDRTGPEPASTDPASTDPASTDPASTDPAAGPESQAEAIAADGRLAGMPYRRAVLIGTAQILALLPGISRDGVVMVTGMVKGLSRADAARYSFLLSAPVILAAGVLKVPDLLGPLGNGIRGQVLLGSVLSGVGAYLSLRFLVRYFAKARSLAPFGIYCLAAGLASLAYLTLR
jgi:undecaprenyl-diphosphatase